MAVPGVDVQYLFAALRVTDRDASLAWYERLFGRPPSFLPNDAEAVWQVAETASVYLLAAGPPIGGGEVTLIVGDLDDQRAALSRRGIATEAVVVVPDAGRKSRVLDPDGNVLWFVELVS
jgi:catechol 2,3-dioxygenase-like lactoylglutathione lyase family enzyme